MAMDASMPCSDLFQPNDLCQMTSSTVMCPQGMGMGIGWNADLSSRLLTDPTVIGLLWNFERNLITKVTYMMMVSGEASRCNLHFLCWISIGQISVRGVVRVSIT